MTTCSDSIGSAFDSRDRSDELRIAGAHDMSRLGSTNLIFSSPAISGAARSDVFQDRAAELSEMVLSHHDLVTRIARRYEGRGLGHADLVEVGTAGLALAAPHFDPAQGTQFSTFASWWIKQAIKNALLVAAKPTLPELWC